MGQQRILRGAVESVKLVNEQGGLSTGSSAKMAGLLYFAAEVGDT
jgi:hypothetical protein